MSTTKATRIQSNSVRVGMALAFCVMGFIQDWMGLEAYLIHVENHWIDVPWQLWVLLFSAFAVYDYRLTGKAEQLDKKVSP